MSPCCSPCSFVIITPLGVAIGAGIGASYQTESKAALGAEGGFNSLSAGMLIYNAIADLMLPTFDEAEMPRQGWLQVRCRSCCCAAWCTCCRMLCLLLLTFSA